MLANPVTQSFRRALAVREVVHDVLAHSVHYAFRRDGGVQGLGAVSGHEDGGGLRAGMWRN